MYSKLFTHLLAYVLFIHVLLKVAPYCLALTPFAFNYSLPDSLAEIFLPQISKYSISQQSGIQMTTRFVAMATRKQVKNKLLIHKLHGENFCFDVFVFNWQGRHFNNFFKKSIHRAQSNLKFV